MNKKVLLIVNGVLALVSGIALVLVPGISTTLLGLQIGPVGLGLARVLGAALITIGILLWMLRKTEDPIVLKAVLTALFVGNLVAALMTLVGQILLLVSSALIAPIQSIIGPMLIGGVQTLVIFLLSLAFTIIYGLLLFRRKGIRSLKQPNLSQKPV